LAIFICPPLAGLTKRPPYQDAIAPQRIGQPHDNCDVFCTPAPERCLNIQRSSGVNKAPLGMVFQERFHPERIAAWDSSNSARELIYTSRRFIIKRDLTSHRLILALRDGI
jgi:hypothetical protein